MTSRSIPADIQAQIDYLTDRLRTNLQGTTSCELQAEIKERIGPLGRPSKMPGFAWGISAELCVTGAKLAQVEGTPCSVCYAMRARYGFPNVKLAQQQRLQGYEDDPDWAELMSIRMLLTAKNHPFFRWFDSGDVQSHDMMFEIQKIARNTNPWIKHWLPTQERRIARDYEPFRPDNLIVRISSTKLGVHQRNEEFPVSFVGKHEQETEGVFQCPSRLQQNSCQTCRACWSPEVRCVEYHQH